MCEEIKQVPYDKENIKFDDKPSSFRLYLVPLRLASLFISLQRNHKNVIRKLKIVATPRIVTKNKVYDNIKTTSENAQIHCGVAERLECLTCNPEDPSSSPTLTASWICFRENLSFKSSATLVNSQLVCLRSGGILNPVMFNLHADLIIYSMVLYSPDGKLSLEVVFFLYCRTELPNLSYN